MIQGRENHKLHKKKTHCNKQKTAETETNPADSQRLQGNRNNVIMNHVTRTHTSRAQLKGNLSPSVCWNGGPRDKMSNPAFAQRLCSWCADERVLRVTAYIKSACHWVLNTHQRVCVCWKCPTCAGWTAVDEPERHLSRFNPVDYFKAQVETGPGSYCDHGLTLLPIMERTSSSGDVGVPEMSGLLLLRLRERLRLRLAGRTAERAMVA